MMICQAFPYPWKKESYRREGLFFFLQGSARRTARRGRVKNIVVFLGKFRRNKGRTWKLISPFFSHNFPAHAAGVVNKLSIEERGFHTEGSFIFVITRNHQSFLITRILPRREDYWSSVVSKLSIFALVLLSVSIPRFVFVFLNAGTIVKTTTW